MLRSPGTDPSSDRSVGEASKLWCRPERAQGGTASHHGRIRRDLAARRRDRKAIGEVRYQDLVLADNRALLAARAAERGES